MTCKEAQRILFADKIDELDAGRKEELEQHLSACTACSDVLNNVSKADGVIAGIRDAVPKIKDPEKLTESIITAIKSTPELRQGKFTTSDEPLLDYLASLFSRPAVRFACSLLLLVCGLSYSIMEYNDMKAIALLEQNLRGSGGKPGAEASGFYAEKIIAQLANDLYEFAQKNLTYDALVDRLGLISKEKRDVLSEGYKNLDEPLRARLDKLRSRFFADNGPELHSSGNAEEARALRREIQEFRKILAPYIGKDKKP